METQNTPFPLTSPSLLPPELKSATPLTALELNGFKLDVKHTVLTPELLDKMAQTKIVSANS